MAERMKTEFQVIGEDGQAFAWEPDLGSAGAHCKPGGGAVRIEKVIYYFEDRETVWCRPDKCEHDNVMYPLQGQGTCQLCGAKVD